MQATFQPNQVQQLGQININIPIYPPNPQTQIVLTPRSQQVYQQALQNGHQHFQFRFQPQLQSLCFPSIHNPGYQPQSYPQYKQNNGNKVMPSQSLSSIDPHQSRLNEFILTQGNLNQSSVKLADNIGVSGEKSRVVNVEPQLQEEGKLEWIKARKWYFVAIVIVLALGVGLAVGLAGRKDDDNGGNGGGTVVFTCVNNPSCAGAPAAVQDYVTATYTDPDQAQAVIQASKSLSLLPTNTSASTSRQSLTDIYRNITRSVQCMSLNLPDSFSETFQKISELQFTTQAQIELYLNMTQSFSGQPLRLTNAANLEQTCRFNLSATRRRRLQQTPTTNQTCTSNATSVLIYFSGIGYSPSSAIQNVYKMQEILSTNSSTNFDAGIIAVGAWRKDGNLGFFYNLVNSYELVLTGRGQIVPSRLYTYSVLQMILNLSRYSRYLPFGISVSYFNNFMRYYVRTSLNSFVNNLEYYDIARHKEFVVNQINEGKKVTLTAHAEGAYYANKVYLLLNSTERQSVSLVYIAPTVSSMADNSTNYITNPNDLVVEGIRNDSLTNSSIPTPLPANVPALNFSSEADFGSNHELPGYASAYKNRLTELIVSAKSRAVQPSRRLGTGPITVTLTWDNQPDVDLHVIQPDGSHVYFSNKTGHNGFLDADDTSSYGPEHYYTNCTLQPGNYTVYLIFYSGYGVSSTITTVSAGTQYFMKSITFSPRQRKNISTIEVLYDNSTASYSFNIYSLD